MTTRTDCHTLGQVAGRRAWGRAGVLLSLLLVLACYSLPSPAIDVDPFGVGAALNMTGAAQAAPQKSTEPTRPDPAPPVAAPTGADLPQRGDYAANRGSDVFGAQLFTGAFAMQGATQFNPDYAITAGDRIQMRFWGAFSYENTLTVDPKGNIFLPNVGPVHVAGVRNEDLQRTVDSAVRRLYRANVFCYASLAAAQPVRVFVAGFVNRPGLYDGTSMDSLLHYLDMAGGIDPERGSFLDVQVRRGDSVRAQVSLYDFLLEGRLPLVQLADGDVIFVPPRQNTVKVTGLAENARRFEFGAGERSVADVIKVAKPLPQATHVRVVRNTGMVKNVEYLPLADASGVRLENGDELQFTSDKKPGTITVRVEGEHQSAQEYVLPYGARLGELLRKIRFSERSDTRSLQLFRTSVKERQKAMLEASLKALEGAALTARSGTSDEARLRSEEADLLLKWVERARRIEPTGQVLIAQAQERSALLLENGDMVRVPTKDGLVLISGEVLFPNAVAYDKRLSLADYISRAGGYTQNADASRVVIAHRDGSFSEGAKMLNGNAADGDFWWQTRREMNTVSVNAGDEILVLPKIDVKSRQIAKDLTQIIYQIAVSAKVVLGL